MSRVQTSVKASAGHLNFPVSCYSLGISRRVPLLALFLSGLLLLSDVADFRFYLSRGVIRMSEPEKEDARE
jgi:hypothetical protein